VVSAEKKGDESTVAVAKMAHALLKLCRENLGGEPSDYVEKKTQSGGALQRKKLAAAHDE